MVNKFRYILAVFGLCFIMTVSCEDDSIKEIETSHVVINASNNTLDTLIYYYDTWSGILKWHTFYGLKNQDTSDVVTLIKAGMEVEFDIYSKGINYKGVFNWSNVVDPSQPQLRSGCYVFWVMNLDTVNKIAEIASKRDIGCQINNF